ncbi:MAG: TonB-dependent receptor [Muribaculaceae bacterium]|nr:TonB-dependent receptor [Muribaculaceae bacterium]
MNSYILKSILFLILSLFSTFSLIAANVTISGKVIDGEDKPIEFATVRIAGSAIGTSTDLQGFYTLSLSERDTIPIIFSCIGFRTVEKKLIHAKGDITLNVRLYTNETELKELEVLGFRNTVNGMQTFDKDAFKTSPDVSGGSVEALLTTMPGVNSSNEMSSQYSVRGGTFDENSVYINNVEVYRPQLVRSGQQEGLSIINPDMVGNLRFSAGGFPARYGDKMSSALDITYREPEAFEGAVALSLMGASLTLGQNSGKFSQLHGVRYKKNNSLLSSMETKGEYDPSFFDYQTNIVWKPSNKFSVNFLGNIALNTYNFKPTDRETSFGTTSDVKHFKVYFDGEEKDKFETYLGAIQLTYRHNKATSFSFNAAAFLTNELVTYDISGEYWLNQAGTGGEEGIGGELGVGKYMEHARDRLKASVIQLGLKGTTRYKINNFTYGINYSRENFRDRTKEWEWRDSAGYSLPTLPEGVHLVYNLSSRHDLSTNRMAAYIEDAMHFENNAFFMSLNAGLRVSYWDFNKELLVSPRVNFSFSPINYNHWNYRAAVGMYYQSPFYKEFRQPVYDELGNVSILLNSDIKSPRSIQFVLGTDYTFRAMNRPFKITAEAYYKNMTNLISYEYDNLKINYSGLNDSDGYAMGLDFKLFGQFVEGSDSWLSFSLMKTQQNLNGHKVPMPSDQRYSLSLFFTDYFPKFPKLKFALKGILADGLTMTPPHTSRAVSYFRAPSYKRVDVGVSYQLVGAPSDKPRKDNFWKNFKSIVIAFDCFNLFDINNVSSYYWVTDVNRLQYAVPNYLTSRQFNLKLSVEF